MPVRWTAETDQILLLKILETSAVSVDVKKVSAAWPSDLETPTPRAISERLVRIRALAKSANGAGAHFAVSGGKTSTPKTTPTKVTKARGTPKSATKASPQKRKRGRRMSEDDSEDAPTEEMNDLGSSSGEDIPVQKKKPRASRVKPEPAEENGADEAIFDLGNVADPFTEKDDGEDAGNAEDEEDWA